MTKYKNCVAVVGNFKYLIKYFPRFYNEITTKGKYKDDIIIITTYLSPTFLIPEVIRNKNIKVLRFKKIRFKKKVRNSYLKLNTGDHPNRFKTKNFQWFKLNLFNKKLKIWKKILYLDINMTIHFDINPILNLKVDNIFLAKADGYPDYKRKLRNQFDTSHNYFNLLEKSFNLNDNKYFQTGLMLFDTNIIKHNTFKNILMYANKYPLSITNEQGILNLFFQKNDDYVYEELPEKIDNKYIYYYWKNLENNIIITKQLTTKNK